MSAHKVFEKTFTSFDGTDIFYRVWQPVINSSKAIVLFHRGHEHSGRWQNVIETLNMDDTAFFAWDARGHGNSPGERGHAPNFQCYVRDADAFVKHISEEYGIAVENMAILAQSVGSVVASAWVHDYAPPIRAMVLGVPAFRVRLYIPFVIPFDIPFAIPLLRLLLKFKPKATIMSYVKSKMITHDKEEMRRYDEDPLITRAIAVNILVDLYDASTRVVEDAGAITAPTMVLTSGSDWVVDKSVQHKFFERLSSPIKEMHEYPGFFHSIFYEKDKHLPLAKAREFLIKAFEHPRITVSLADADKHGYTKNEYDELQKSASPISVRGISFAAAKMFLKTLGRLSNGIQVGWKTGFDSGLSLDYVYENKARGTTILGRLIDRMYLESIGWKGIRQRKENMHKCLNFVDKLLGGAKVKKHILDVASGAGRYVMDFMLSFGAWNTTAHLRDWDMRNVEAIRNLAEYLQLKNEVSCSQGDAFDYNSLVNIVPTPNISIVSGLYELFPENDKILTSLKGIHAGMKEGGYLIYTNQPWHPQLEFIAKVLPNREGKPWIMRRRTQQEMDELVRLAGFEKIKMEVDDYGIFTVSVAERK